MNIQIKGAREHNLKNIDIDIPKKKLVLFTGVSGSGKSSLVFNTIFSEAQRQFLESLSTHTRKNLPKFSRPNVDEIRNLSLTIMIDQKRLGRNPRSTVGTVTEIYTYLRLLFSRCGTPILKDSSLFSFNTPDGMCRTCKGLGVTQGIDPHKVLDFDKSLSQGAARINIFKPGARYYNIIKVSGKIDVDKPIKNYTKKELDFLLYSPKVILSSKSQGFVQSFSHEGIIRRVLTRINDPRSPWGRDKLEDSFLELRACDDCKGSRLSKWARNVKVNGKTIPDLVSLELTDLKKFIKTVKGPLESPISKRIEELLSNLIDIGVGYLSLNQSVATLSGGESQRVKMARQLGSDLVDLVYILDEPSIGLHQRDIGQLVSMLKKLRDSGNSVLVVEHDPSVIKSADHIIDLGPGAGKRGGELVFEGSLNRLKNSNSLTGKYLVKDITKTKKVRRKPGGFISIKNASLHNLKNISVNIPKGVFTCVTGVAGSGKSSLINDIFAKENKSIVVDQSAVGNNIRSNPATYTGVFNLIREEFAKATHRPASFFSFNSKGACPKCGGLGFISVEMHFLDNVNVECSLCQGKRYTPAVLDLKYKGKNIYEVLEMTAREASNFFDSKDIKRRLKLLEEVGLDYLELGQPLNSLSGGEAQRIKLARELHKKGNIYILDEPTTGLHMSDIEKLLKVLDSLVEYGNTVVVIEHNLDVIKNADWIIDLGPEGGAKGGRIVAEGRPEDIKKGYTAEYLKKVLQNYLTTL